MKGLEKYVGYQEVKSSWCHWTIVAKCTTCTSIKCPLICIPSLEYTYNKSRIKSNRISPQNRFISGVRRKVSAIFFGSPWGKDVFHETTKNKVFFEKFTRNCISSRKLRNWFVRAEENSGPFTRTQKPLSKPVLGRTQGLLTYAIPQMVKLGNSPGFPASKKKLILNSGQIVWI